MGLAAFAFVALAGMPVDIVPQKIAQSVNSFPLLAAPLFILMGNIMNSAGITDRIFAFATACVGWVRGGLCHANILASVIFAGMSGSAVADAGGVGSLEIRAMKKEGYDAETAAAITAASATIGPIIPPSLPMVIYGVTADVSIGGLFLAGVIPGLLMAGALAAMVTVVATRRNLPRHPFPGFGDLWMAYKRAHWALMTPVILFGGMMAGIMTPTEAAAVATVYALFLGLFVYRDFDLRELPKLIVDTVETTGMVLALVMTAAALAWCLSIARVPQTVTPLIVDSVGNPLLFLLDRQRAAALRRLLHGGAGGDADPDPDPDAGRRATRHRSDPVRPDLRAQPDDRHDHAAGRRRALHHLEDRRHQLRGDVARDRALAHPAARRARSRSPLWPPLTTWLPKFFLGY